MADYISREAAKKAFCEYCDWAEAGSEYCKSCPDPIGKIPAADVVPVVRCGECRYAYDSVGGWCCSHGICVDCVVREDFFCADGERMDGDGDV